MHNLNIKLPYDELIRECPSPQCRGYMQEKQEKMVQKLLYEVLIASINEGDKNE